MKKLLCFIIIIVCTFSAIPSSCESFLMSLHDFSTKFSEATILHKTNHAFYFVKENMTSYVDEAGSSLEIRFPIANCTMCLYLPYNDDYIKEIIVISQGGQDSETAKEFLFLLRELCYATGAYTWPEEWSSFSLSDLGVGFNNWNAGFFDRNSRRYSWILNNDVGFIFTIQPL